MVLASGGYPLLNAMWTMFIFFGWVIWVWLLFTVFSDLFRRDDVSGGGKAGWVLFMLVLPFVGVLVYLIGQGSAMGARQSERQQAAVRRYETAQHNGSNGQSASEISKAKDLLDSGTITTDEFETLKRKALA